MVPPLVNKCFLLSPALLCPSKMSVQSEGLGGGAAKGRTYAASRRIRARSCATAGSRRAPSTPFPAITPTSIALTRSPFSPLPHPLPSDAAAASPCHPFRFKFSFGNTAIILPRSHSAVKTRTPSLSIRKPSFLSLCLKGTSLILLCPPHPHLSNPPMSFSAP